MADVDEERRNKSKELAHRGFDCIEKGNYEAALKIAEELEGLRYSAAFDIAAQAYLCLGKLEKAVETLERGVSKAPECWLSWQLLGNSRSDMEEYDGAEEAYERALMCPGVWKDSIRLNQAILWGRRGDHKRSLVYLDMVKDSDLALHVAASRIDALEGLGNLDEALSLANDCLNKKCEEESTLKLLARIAAKQGRIRLAKGCTKDEVRLSAIEALEDFGCSGDLLALVRDIDGRYSTKAQYLRLLIQRTIPEDDPLHQTARGYFITYDVVAQSPEQALEFVREFEHTGDSSAALKIEESHFLEERPEDPMGIYWWTGRCYYAKEDES